MSVLHTHTNYTVLCYSVVAGSPLFRSLTRARARTHIHKTSLSLFETDRRWILKLHRCGVVVTLCAGLIALRTRTNTDAWFNFIYFQVSGKGVARTAQKGVLKCRYLRALITAAWTFKWVSSRWRRTLRARSSSSFFLVGLASSSARVHTHTHTHWESCSKCRLYLHRLTQSLCNLRQVQFWPCNVLSGGFL